MSAGFDDDEQFKNLAKRREFMFHKLSWHCSQFECEQCDGKIHYEVKRFKAKIFSAATGEFRDEYEDLVWDTEHTQVQLEGGVLQNRENTPEGTKCECFCHKPRPKNAGPPQFTPSHTGERVDIRPTGKKRHQMLTTEEKKDLR